MQHNLQANYFVINKFMDSADIYSSCNVKTFTPPPAPSNSQVGQLYARLYKQIESHIDALHMNVTRTKSYTNVMRIVLNSLGGLAWNDLCTEQQQQQEHHVRHLCRFLLNLRALMRHSLAVCLVTVPNQLIGGSGQQQQSLDLHERFTHLSDYSFVLDDSVKATSGLTATEYDGLFRLVKIPRLNSLMASCGALDTLDLAFHMKRKRLVVEQLHLPPDIGEADGSDDAIKGRTGTASLTATNLSCTSASSKPSKFDF